MEFRFNHYGTYLKKTFGGRVFRITVDGGFTCPNRDGTVGVGGCIYCNNDAFSAGITAPHLPVADQVRLALEEKRGKKRYRGARFLVYFQKYTNTYAPPDVLEKLYESALVGEEIVGIVVGTRPDCIDGEIARVLKKLSEKTHVSVELGLQTTSDEVLKRINRGHTFEDYLKASDLLAREGVEFGVHLIYGLPGDTRENFLKGADEVSRTGASLVKLNHIHVVRDTELERAWRRGEFSPPSFEEYLEAVCDFLERLSPSVVVARLISTTPPELLLAPRWEVGSARFVTMVNEELERRGTRQGALFEEEGKAVF